MLDIPNWLLFECILRQITNSYPDVETSTAEKGNDPSGIIIEDIKIIIPSKNQHHNIRIYFPDRVVQRDRMKRVCSLLKISIEKLDEECSVQITSFK